MVLLPAPHYAAHSLGQDIMSVNHWSRNCFALSVFDCRKTAL